MSRLFRQALRRATPGAVLRLTLDGLGVFCACTLVWEHFFTIQRSEGPSMYPTFSTRGDWLLISRRHDHGRGIQVGDVVRFYHPTFLGVNGAKRVLGMPGDFVCKDPPFSTEVGEEGEMIQVCFLQKFIGCRRILTVNQICSRSPKVMSFSPVTISPGRETRGITDLCLWAWSMGRSSPESGLPRRSNG